MAKQSLDQISNSSDIDENKLNSKYTVIILINLN